MKTKKPLKITRDTREQDGCGWTFDAPQYDPKPVLTVKTLTTGDYSLTGLEHLVCVERKEMQDLVGCLGAGRERFERELERMRSMESACVIVEGPQLQLQGGNYRGALNPLAAWQSVLSFAARYRVPWFFCRDKYEAERCAYDYLRHYANEAYRRLKALVGE